MSFNNLKIKTKIVLGFLLLMVIAFILGAVSYIYIGKLSSTIADISDVRTKILEYSAGIERASLTMVMEQKDILLNADIDTKNIEERFKEQINAAKDYLNKLEELSRKQNDETLLSSTDKSRNALLGYDKKYNEVLSLLTENRNIRNTMYSNDENLKKYIETFYKKTLSDYNKQNSEAGAAERLILVENIQKQIASIERDVEREMAKRNGVGYKNANNLFSEFVQLLGRLKNTVTDRDYLDTISEMETAAINYKTSFTGLVNNQDKLKGYVSDMDKLASDLLEAARDAQELQYKNVEKERADAAALISQANIVIVASIITAIILGIMLAIILASAITKPIVKGVGFAKKLAKGDLSVMLDIKQKDEIGALAGALNEMVRSLRDIVANITTSANNVAAAADQVAQSSQSLSQGTTEQASSLEEISSSLNEINSQSKQNADNAIEANALAKTSAENAEKGNNRMSGLVSAMEKINKSSEDIKKVVKVIDDIAFQINLLALNANVEAARAGKYGKGFAVVAEEIRNLAERSANAVKETDQMVAETIQNVEEGTKAAEATATQLNDIVTGSSKVADFLGEIALASKEQAQGVEQITTGVEQIDQVTQANTASAEESAAAAEELASQAQQMKGIVSTFKLKSSGNGKGSMSEAHSKITHEEYPETSIQNGNGKGKIDSSSGIGMDTQQHSYVDPKEVIKLDDDDFGKF